VLNLAVATPVWGLGGLIWGLLMLVIVGGDPLGWLFAGIFWGMSCWFFFSIWLVIGTREQVVRLPMIDVPTLHERLAKILKRNWYRVEQQSPTRIVCKPKFGLPRLLDYNNLLVQVGHDAIELIGPAVLVKKVRKKLAAA
jgi:hypothetical protein